MHKPPTVARRPSATWLERFGHYPLLKAQVAVRVAFSTASSDQIEVYADMPCDLGGAANCMTSQLNGFALHVGAASSFLGYGQSFQPVWPAPFSSFSVLTRQNSTLCSSLRDDTRTGISHIPFWFTGYMSYSALPSNPLCIPDTHKFNPTFPAQGSRISHIVGNPVTRQFSASASVQRAGQDALDCRG